MELLSFFTHTSGRRTSAGTAGFLSMAAAFEDQPGVTVMVGVRGQGLRLIFGLGLGLLFG